MKGIVYQIYIETNRNIHYVGSTSQTLNNRWKNHLNAFQTFLVDRSKIVSIYPYFESLGVDNFKIRALREYDVVDKKHLIAYEQLWINKLKPINIIKHLFKTRHLIKTLDRLDYHKNKEVLLQRCKAYYEKNSEDVKKRVQKYRENNTEKIKERKSKLYTCPCTPNKEMLFDHKSRHEISKKHYKYLDSI